MLSSWRRRKLLGQCRNQTILRTLPTKLQTQGKAPRYCDQWLGRRSLRAVIRKRKDTLGGGSIYLLPCLLTYLLTYSVVQIPSWESNWFAASQEIPRISLNPKVHYRTHKRPPSVSILGQPNTFHIPTSHLLENHPDIIHPSTPKSPQWSLSLRFPHQDHIHPPLLTHTRKLHH